MAFVGSRIQRADFYLNLERSLGNEPKHLRQARSDSAQRRFPSAFKGVASGRTGVRGGPRLFNQLADEETGAESGPAGSVGTPRP